MIKEEVHGCKKEDLMWLVGLKRVDDSSWCLVKGAAKSQRRSSLNENAF